MGRKQELADGSIFRHLDAGEMQGTVGSQNVSKLPSKYLLYVMLQKYWSYCIIDTIQCIIGCEPSSDWTGDFIESLAVLLFGIAAFSIPEEYEWLSVWHPL